MTDLTRGRVRVRPTCEPAREDDTKDLTGIVTGLVPDDGEGDLLVIFDGDTTPCRVPADACTPLAASTEGEEPASSYLWERAVEQPGLFEEFEHDWRREWQAMPEYSHEDLAPACTVKVHFGSAADRQAFARLIDQPLTTLTQSIWYPAAEIGRFTNKRWVDES
jgi:hypothetical protein